MHFYVRVYAVLPDALMCLGHSSDEYKAAACTSAIQPVIWSQKHETRNN
jgi:hypothetical protein